MNDLASFLSAEVGPLGARVEGYVRGHELIWRQAPAEPLPPKKRFACREKRAVEHTEAVFAYSMVYPYLDNMLDDAGTSEAGKLAAQVKSLLQQRLESPPPPGEILGISFEKGGTSVLANGYLVAGRLDPADEDFCFGFGTFLQLADDLQDVAEDADCGHRTLFSRRAGRAPLDATAARLEGYLAAVLERARAGAMPRRSALCDAIESGLSLMFRESVGKHPGHFSRGFVRRARRAFPVRFSYLKKLRLRLKGKMPEGCDRLADLDPGLVALMAVSSRAFALD